MSNSFTGRKNLVNTGNETLQNELGLRLVFISSLKMVQKHCISEIRGCWQSCTYGKGPWTDMLSSNTGQEPGGTRSTPLSSTEGSHQLGVPVFPPLESSSSNAALLGDGEVGRVEH